MPDQNTPDNTPATRHAAEVKSMTIKLYCTIAFADLVVLGLFPSWLVANILAVCTAAALCAVTFCIRAYIDAPAQEDDGDDSVELREGVGQSMVSEWMAGRDGERGGDDAGGLGDVGDNDVNDSNNNTDNDGNNDKDDGKDEHEEEKQEADDEDRKKAENKDINNIDTCHIYGTRTNIYVTQGGSMHIHVAPDGTFNVNVHEDAAVMEAEREE